MAGVGVEHNASTRLEKVEQAVLTGPDQLLKFRHDFGWRTNRFMQALYAHLMLLSSLPSPSMCVNMPR
jgi:hypothetical protein